MKSRLIIVSVLACVILAIAASVEAARAQDNSPSNPAAIGVPVKSTLELGSSYDLTITVLEAVRGKEAMERLKAASANNKPPKSAFEYVLARVKFELKSRAVSENRTFDLARPMQWIALSSDAREYESVSVTAPKPELTGSVRSGSPVEGWIAFAAEQKESKPMMMFDPASGGAMLRGKILFFKLY